MCVKIISVPGNYHSLDDVTDEMVLGLGKMVSTVIETLGMFVKPCGQGVSISNGTDDDIEKLRKVGIVVERIPE